MRLSRSNLKELAVALEGMYGPITGRGGSYEDRVLLDDVGCDPLDILVATILSQATSDRNSIRSFKRLKQEFETWERVRQAPVSDLEETIRGGGLASQKAERLKAILNGIARERGVVSLDFLRDWDTEAAFRYLVGFKGVGPKTAACILLFGFGRPCFPVDTHVLRVMRRIGMAGKKQNASRLQEVVERIIPRGLERDLHINLIRHGRKTCRAQSPRCGECDLRQLCAAQKEKAPYGGHRSPP